MHSRNHQNTIWQQVKALFLINVKMDFRGHRAFSQRQPKLSPFVWNLIVYTLMSGFLSVRLFTDVHPSQITFLLFTYSMVMIFFAVLMETGHTLVNPEDSEILAFQPLHDTVYFTAKLLNMIFYVFLITVALGMIPCIFYDFQFGLKYGMILFPLLFLANLWSTAFVVFIYAGLIQLIPFQKFKDILGFIQMGFAFVLFFSYNLLPRIGWQSVQHSQLSQHILIQIMPSSWFARLSNLLFGSTSFSDWFFAALALCSFLFLLLMMFKRLSFAFSQKLLLLQHDDSVSRSKKGEKLFPITNQMIKFVLRSKEAITGFQLASIFLKRDRVVKLSVYSMLGFPLAFLVLAILMKASPDFFSSSFLEESATLIHGSIIFIFIMIFSIMQGMIYSLDWEAAWFYAVVPLQSPAKFFKGIQLLILIRLMIPFFLVYGLIYNFMVFNGEGVNLTLQLFGLSVTGLAIVPFFIKDFPFSKNRQKGEGSRSIIMVFFVVPFWGAAIIFQKIAEQFTWGLWTQLVFLFFLAWLLEIVGIRRLNQVLSQKECFH